MASQPKEGKTSRIILILLVIALGAMLVYNWRSTPLIEGPKEYIERIDSLESEISSLQRKKDSISVSIDTIYIRLKNNESSYEKDRNTIINNTVADDYEFFTDYINRNRARLDSINNSRATEIH